VKWDSDFISTVSGLQPDMTYINVQYIAKKIRGKLHAIEKVKLVRNWSSRGL